MKLMNFLGYFGRINPDAIDQQKIEFMIDMEPGEKRLFLRRVEYDVADGTWIMRFGIK